MIRKTSPAGCSKSSRGLVLKVGLALILVVGITGLDSRAVETGEYAVGCLAVLG
jgi:hypothetical protein